LGHVVVSVHAGGRAAVPALGENRVPPPRLLSGKTNNECQVKSKLIQQKHVWRARIVLPTADGKGTNAITEAIGKDKTTVWRWQERFMHEAVAGLRARGAGRQSGPRRARQLRYSQASQGDGLAAAASTLHLPLHPANAVEGLFAKLPRHRLKRGVFTSIVELQAAINRFIAETNDKPKPFVWTKSADAILAVVNRGRQALEAIH